MKDLRIHISSGSVVRVVLILFAFYLLFTIREIILLLIASVIIAAAVEPAARWFVRHRLPRIPAVIIVYVAGIVALSAIFYFFIPPLFTQFLSFVHMVPQYLSELDVNLGAGQSAGILNHLSDNLTLTNTIAQMKQFASSSAGGFLQLLTDIFGGFLGIILVVVISFYLSVQDRGIEKFLRLITPIKNQHYVVDLWTRSQHKIGRWFQGQLLLGVIIGVLVFLGLKILGFEGALFLAFIAGLFELIPIFGPILAAIPAVAIGFTISPTMALLTVVLYIIVQQFENNLIQPMVMKKVVGISPLISIIALVVGGSLAGFLGILLAIPIAAVVMEFLGDVSKEKAFEKKELETEELEAEGKEVETQERHSLKVKRARD